VPKRFGQLQFNILDHLHLSNLAAFPALQLLPIHGQRQLQQLVAMAHSSTHLDKVMAAIESPGSFGNPGNSPFLIQ